MSKSWPDVEITDDRSCRKDARRNDVENREDFRRRFFSCRNDVENREDFRCRFLSCRNDIEKRANFRKYVVSSTYNCFQNKFVSQDTVKCKYNFEALKYHNTIIITSFYPG